ncbi:DUF2235 domain-containing protein [Mycena sanguinolenta]|uniref:DUF2235 domain-containing protein n=1 Tax=Mycena sanguinolenta TaxID=230812 RepID=A0A8H7D4E6_9AGAR|nr:DUF2235 domain-containing protein [Mycena sanguinolenta]
MEPSSTINTQLHNRFETDHTLTDQNGISGLPLAGSPQSSSFTQHPLNGSAPSTTGVIPPEHPFRTLVLCFDGTGDQFDNDNSNIVQLFSMLHKGDRSRQMVYYQAGIGTYTSPQIATPFWSKISKVNPSRLVSGTAGSFVFSYWTKASLCPWMLMLWASGYEFLMQNCAYCFFSHVFADLKPIQIPPTIVFVFFGFSRGAYTARSLAGMIHKVGLLPADNHQQIPFAYKMYTNNTEVGWDQSNAFKKAFSIDVDIEFVGVWDTVNSVGIFPRRLPFTTSNTIIRTFRHAVSLDERRAKFKANLWNRPNEQEQTLSISDQKAPQAKHSHPPKKVSQVQIERRYSRDRSQATDIDEVWFAGCHCDVGGGSVDNDVVQNLARIPLRWMIRECFKTNSGIMFTCEGLRSIGLDPDKLYPDVAPRPPALPLGNLRIQSIPSSKQQSKKQAEVALINFADGETTSPTHKTEEELDLLDSICPIYDQLSLSWPWWILEFFPIKQRYQKGDNSWVAFLGWNMGKGRFIPKQKTNGVRVHRSVKTRLEAQTESGGKYEPKAAFDLERTTWVD